MLNAVFFSSYKLKKGVSVPDFLLAAETLSSEHISKLKGYVSMKQFVDNDTWADAITFETMEDAKNFLAEARNPNAFAEKFYSFININSCKSHLFSVERSY